MASHRNIVPEMQALPTPEIPSQSYELSPYHLSTGETTQPSQHSHHFPQQHFQDDSSHIFSVQNAVGSNFGQQPQLEPPSSILPSQPINTSQGHETRRSVACLHCRSLKVRCLEVAGSPSCQKCLDTNQVCEMIEPKRKKAKKPDKAEREILDLQDQIHNLTQELAIKTEALKRHGYSDAELNNLSHPTQFTHTHLPNYQVPIPYHSHAGDHHGLNSLQAPHTFEAHHTLLGHKRTTLSHENQSPNTHQPPPPAQVAHNSAGQVDANSHTMAPTTPAASGPSQKGVNVPAPMGEQVAIPMGVNLPFPRYSDVLWRFVPRVEDAYDLFNRFVTSMAPQIPIMVFPARTDAIEIFTTKPQLFLAILSVAAPSEIQAQLSIESLRILGHSIIVNQEASLELIQALQVITLWFWPPGGRDARCSQYCSMACTMAISLGMNTPSRNEGHWSLWSAEHSEESGEGARAYLGCFILSSMYVKRRHCYYALPLSWR